MLKIGQNWAKIANYPPNAQQRFAPLPTRAVTSSREDFKAEAEQIDNIYQIEYFYRSPHVVYCNM